MANENQIHITNGGLAARRIEHPASATIKPGYLVERHVASSVKKLRPHGTAKGFAERIFAVEDSLQGGTIAGSYSSGDIVPAHIVPPGDEVVAWLKAGTNYTEDVELVSAGDGTLQATSSSDLQAIAKVVEATDLSASGAVATQAKVRVI